MISNSMIAKQMGRGRGKRKYLVISNEERGAANVDRGAQKGDRGAGKEKTLCWEPGRLSKKHFQPKLRSNILQLMVNTFLKGIKLHS